MADDEGVVRVSRAPLWGRAVIPGLHATLRRTITVLDVSDCALSIESFNLIHRFLLDPRSLVGTLILNECRLPYECICLLFEALPAVRLRNLSLDGNFLGPTGSAALAHGLASNPDLECLTLRGCGLGSGACAEIAAHLHSARSLTKLLSTQTRSSTWVPRLSPPPSPAPPSASFPSPRTQSGKRGPPRSPPVSLLSPPSTSPPASSTSTRSGESFRSPRSASFRSRAAKSLARSSPLS